MQDRHVVAEIAPGAAYSRAVVAGGLVYISGVNGLPDPGATGDSTVIDETNRAFGRLKSALEAAGSSLADLVAVNVYLKRTSDFDLMNAAYKTYFTDNPPARTTVAAEPDGGGFIEISAVAQLAGAPREAMIPTGWVKSARPYSYAIRTGDLVFLSGLVSRRGTDDQVVPGSVAMQTETILTNAATLLKTAGLTLKDVVSARVYLTDDSMFEAMNAEYEHFFPDDPPARATGVVGLMGPETYVEITLVASRTPKEVLGPRLSPTLPVSTAVRAGRRTFFSGVLGQTEANVGDQAAQAREALTKMAHNLELTGVTAADVVDSTVYLGDRSGVAAFDAVFHEFFPTDPPARTVVGAKLVNRSGLAEIILTAVK
jgi:2-iminobutanoate/2-iminopropanoate deaminase